MQKLDSSLKIAHAAKILGVSANTLRTWADDGKVPAMINPANGYHLFRQEDLEAFLTQAAEPVCQKNTRTPN